VVGKCETMTPRWPAATSRRRQGFCHGEDVGIPGYGGGRRRRRARLPLMPRYFDVRPTALPVGGYGILCEEEGRPVAHAVKKEIASRGAGQPGGSAVVVTDMWMLNQDMADLFPAVAIGGPGANAFSAQVYEELPVVFARDQRVFIQMDRERGKRAALWGMDSGATRAAAEVFIQQGLLEEFLDLVWRRKA